jgi:hypothetical protein
VKGPNEVELVVKSLEREDEEFARRAEAVRRDIMTV